MKVALTEPVYARIAAHARAAYPEECCGLMIGAVPGDFGAADCALTIDDARPLDNHWDEGDKKRRFRMDPNAVAAIEKELSGTGRGVLGVYHSHPEHPARPSATDLDHAWPALAYVIVSVESREPVDARVWRMRDDRDGFDEGALILPESVRARKTISDTLGRPDSETISRSEERA